MLPSLNCLHCGTAKFSAVTQPFLSLLEENWKDVLEELENLLYNEAESGKSYFAAWPETEIYEGCWDVFSFYVEGEKIQSNCSFCPKTTALIDRVPGVRAALFSGLGTETYIKPHVGYSPDTLRCHLGLITPKRSSNGISREHPLPLINCGMRVGDITYTWSPGRAFVFDSSEEHEAFNYGDRTRFILVIDFKKESFPSDMV